jgi:hypothetical protein
MPSKFAKGYRISRESDDVGGWMVFVSGVEGDDDLERGGSYENAGT